MKPILSIFAIATAAYSTSAFAGINAYDRLKQICETWSASYGSPDLNFNYVDPFGKPAQNVLSTEAASCITDLTSVSFTVRRVKGPTNHMFTAVLSEGSNGLWDFNHMLTDCTTQLTPVLSSLYAARMTLTDQFKLAIQHSVDSSICPSQMEVVKEQILKTLQ
jgi:hypothetical protein